MDDLITSIWNDLSFPPQIWSWEFEPLGENSLQIE